MHTALRAAYLNMTYGDDSALSLAFIDTFNRSAA